MQEEGVTRIIMYSNKPADNVSEVVTVPAGPEERLLVLDLFEFHSIEWDRRERRGESPFTPVSFVPHVLDKHVRRGGETGGGGDFCENSTVCGNPL